MISEKINHEMNCGAFYPAIIPIMKPAIEHHIVERLKKMAVRLFY